MSIFGKEPIENLKEGDIELLKDITLDIVDILEREVKKVDYVR
jgi:hypothetical protein